MPDWIALAVLAGAGLVAGYMNAIAGAGSLLTLPALIFTGLDASAANATNRISVFAQSAVAVVAYRRNGVSAPKRGFVVALAATAASGAGAWVATLLDERAMRVSIAVAMVVFALLSLVPPKKKDEKKDKDENEKKDKEPEVLPWASIAGFLAIGFYAGFLQAGVGILILLYLSLVHGMSLVIANALKVLAVAVFTAGALVIFVWTGETLDLVRGAVLAVATSAGAWLGTRAAVKHGERFIRVAVVGTVLVSAAKLGWDAFAAS